MSNIGNYIQFYSLNPIALLSILTTSQHHCLIITLSIIRISIGKLVAPTNNSHGISVVFRVYDQFSPFKGRRPEPTRPSMGSASSIHSLLPLLIHLLLPPIPFSSPSPEPLSQAALHFLDDAKSPELLGWMVGIRRTLHQHPELGYEEHETSKLVRSELDLLGIPNNHPVAVTGVVGFVGTGKAPFVVITADMDALAFQVLLLCRSWGNSMFRFLVLMVFGVVGGCGVGSQE